MRKLLQLTKALLVAAGLGVGATCAWAQTTTVTYDFTSFSNQTLSASTTTAVNYSAVNYMYPTALREEMGSRFAFRYNQGTWEIASGLKWNSTSKDDNFTILNVTEGDIITINISSGSVFAAFANQLTGTYYTSKENKASNTTTTGDVAQWGVIKSGESYTVKSTGNLYLQGKRKGWTSASNSLTSTDVDYCIISSISVVTSTAETVTAPTITSVAADGGRTVTITSGASNISAGVATYYTTDGTTPTASSTKYTGSFLQATSATINAITISTSSAATASTVASAVVDLETVDVPTAAITAVNGTSRRVTFSCTTDGVTFSYSTDGGSSFTTADYVDIDADTDIIVKATKGDKSSQSETLSFEAGTEVAMNAPSLAVTWLTKNGEYYYPVITPSYTATGVLLEPAVASYSYTFTPTTGDAVNGVIAVGGTYTFTAPGTLAVTAVGPSGYSNSVAESYTGVAYAELCKYDFTDTDWTRGFTSGMSTGWPSGANQYNTTDKIFNSDYSSANSYTITASASNFDFLTMQADQPLVEGLGIVNCYTGGRYFQITTAPSTGYAIVNKKYNGTSGAALTAFVANADIKVASKVYIDRYTCLQSVSIFDAVPASVTKEITSAGWATYCSPYALDFSSSIANLEAAYIVTGGSEGVLTKTPVTGIVPAGTGLLLKGEGDCAIPTATTSTVDVSSNKLAGVTYGTKIAPEAGYVLMGSPSIAFYKNTNQFTVGANTAYLPSGFDGAGARAFYSLFDDGDVTAIEGVTAQQGAGGFYYNLNGQRVSQPTKDLYIVGGKKVVKK